MKDNAAPREQVLRRGSLTQFYISKAQALFHFCLLVHRKQVVEFCVRGVQHLCRYKSKIPKGFAKNIFGLKNVEKIIKYVPRTIS